MAGVWTWPWNRSLRILAAGHGYACYGRTVFSWMACPVPRGIWLHQGQVLSLRPKEMGHGACIDDVPVIHRTTDYAALLKPQGLDSASIAGADNARSVERLLDKLFPHEDARLCNRLDRPTSGILLVGFGPDAVDRFRSLEERGLVDKRYYALVWGRFASPVTVDKALDTAQRKVTRVLDETAPELRWTRARPLRQVAGADGEQTLVEACIRKGARHQIRAHLAGIGHPIVGDSLYGPEKPGYDMLHLHHAELRMPDFLAACDPEWLENI